MNITEATKLSERLEETLRKYHNRAVDSVQIIEDSIALVVSNRSTLTTCSHGPHRLVRHHVEAPVSGIR